MTPMTPTTDTVKPQTSSQLMDETNPLCELIGLAGKDGVGKTCGCLSFARYAEALTPQAKFYYIDSEKKVRAAMRSFGADAPSNLVYFPVDNMNQATRALETVLSSYTPFVDWLAVESAARLWEYAQDLAYLAIEGVDKAEYLANKPKKGPGSGPIPTPDDFWKIAKGAHDGAFFYRITAADNLNRIITTTITKPPKEAFQKQRENADRAAFRVETGVDANIDGAPKVPTWMETFALVNLKGGRVSCQIVRDNMSRNENTRVEFDVVDKKSLAFDFYENCRG